MKKRRSLKISKSKEELAYQVLKTQAEIQSLQQQINPHFLYNTLEAIRAQALADEADSVAEMIELLARVFRYNIGQRRKYATLNEELKNIRDYVAIQNYRFRDRFKLIEDYSDLDDLRETYSLPVLTLQPIVENALHHGLEKKIGPGTIRITIFTTAQNLLIQIQDDGIGMRQDDVHRIQDKLNSSQSFNDDFQSGNKGNGIALLNVHQRLRLIFGDQYGLNITSVAGIGTTVEIALPKNPIQIPGAAELP